MQAFPQVTDAHPQLPRSFHPVLHGMFPFSPTFLQLLAPVCSCSAAPSPSAASLPLQAARWPVQRARTGAPCLQGPMLITSVARPPCPSPDSWQEEMCLPSGAERHLWLLPTRRDCARLSLSLGPGRTASAWSASAAARSLPRSPLRTSERPLPKPTAPQCPLHRLLWGLPAVLLSAARIRAAPASHSCAPRVWSGPAHMVSHH